MKRKFTPFLGLALLLSGVPSIGFSTLSAEQALPDVWDGSVAKKFAGGTGTQDDPYTIETCAQLAFLQKYIANYSYFSGKYVSLINDLDLNNIQWPGIGNGYQTGAFKGTFLGNNHAITNVKMDVNAGRRGFFNSNAGTIEDLNLSGSLVSTAASSSEIYGLLASINYGTLKNNTVSGDLTVAGRYAAGIAGYGSGGRIEGCSFKEGTLRAGNCSGGIVGYNAASANGICNIVNCHNGATIIGKDYPAVNFSGMGGICGVVGSGAQLTGCVNTGQIIGEGNAYGGTAGIVGNLFSSTLIDCVNKGKVTAIENAGGISGYARTGATIVDCRNEGLITGDKGVAGIAGYNYANITNSSNAGEINGEYGNNGYWIGGIVGMLGSVFTIKGCQNSGFVHGRGSSAGGVGGIIGSNYNSYVLECENTGHVKGLYRVGGIVGYAQNTKGVVDGCVNRGVYETVGTFGTVSLGGIIGYNQATVTNNHNYGESKTPEAAFVEMVGGIVGYDTVGSYRVYGNEDHYGE